MLRSVLRQADYGRTSRLSGSLGQNFDVVFAIIVALTLGLTVLLGCS
jgi:hypothetical protein